MRNNRLSRFIAPASLVLAFTSPALSAPPNQTNCTITIGSCGCVIASSGTYKVGLNLTAAQGLNGDDSCLSIAASYVTVDFGKKTITNRRRQTERNRNQRAQGCSQPPARGPRCDRQRVGRRNIVPGQEQHDRRLRDHEQWN